MSMDLIGDVPAIGRTVDEISAQLNQTAQAMGRLADLVHKLSESVADFKLPGDKGTGK